MEQIRNLNTTEALVLSDYILKNYGPMSHLKLQKLLFYCQAYHLAYFGSPIINEDFQAWVHGPVCRAVYDSLKDKSVLYTDVKFSGDDDYDPNYLIDETLLSTQKELLTDILKELSLWTGLELESATHRELPWIEARRGFSSADACEEIISKESMKAFYFKELNE